MGRQFVGHILFGLAIVGSSFIHEFHPLAFLILAAKRCRK